MTRFRAAALRSYLLNGQISSRGCARLASLASWTTTHAPTPPGVSPPARAFHHAASEHAAPVAPAARHVPVRKQMKDEAKKQKAAGKKKKKNANNQVVDGWELTVGIEIHAQLNTARKLFSPATTSFNDEPNSHVALFDLAIPGSQPLFQPETLIPALRAALALDCDIQPVSRFDRKHYFHWDQPSGYQITQYYEPFARAGHIPLSPRDGIAPEDGDGIVVGIRQIQMEQDTAKTLAQPGDMHWVDFNRVGVPLVEIITQPDIHHPATAAALVRKVQTLLNAVDACVSGMEAGGLRADVNVSVRRSDDPHAPLGQRTEIKNLSSFKAVEDAIIAERDRQISVLEAGGLILGETRGWSIGSTETRRLRGKEGEVDYRYMPDPDLGPVVIGSDLVRHLRETMGQLPDAEVDGLVREFDLTPKDALSLSALDGGGRLEYFYNVVDELKGRLGRPLDGKTDARLAVEPDNADDLQCFQLAANWILHELGRLTGERSEAASSELSFTADGQCARVPGTQLADIIHFLHTRRITARIAKELLWLVFRGGVGEGPDARQPTVRAVIDAEDLWFHELSADEYQELAEAAADGQVDVIRLFADYHHRSSLETEAVKAAQFPQGKLMFLVGRMIRLGQEERIDPRNAEKAMRNALEHRLVPRLVEESQ